MPLKLLRYGLPDKELPGLLDQHGRIRDLSDHVDDITSKSLSAGLLARLAALEPDSLKEVNGSPRLGVPVGNIGKIICVGLNYRDHAEESGMEIPDEPVLFAKATTAINGPNDPVILPRGWSKADWEVELGIVISKTARYVDESDASDYVAGYCVANDLSERSFQLEQSGQWIKGKSCDTFAPLGPWLVTKDEVPDPGNLAIWLEVNGHRYQDGNTSTMIFKVPEIISYISRFMTLMPGDVIITGTPPGVGMGQRPPVYLKPGDQVRLGIDHLGCQLQQVYGPDELAGSPE